MATFNNVTNTSAQDQGANNQSTDNTANTVNVDSPTDSVIVNGKRGNDVITVNGETDDEIRGGKQDDILSAGGGNDFIAAGRGSDLINAGDGNDVVEAWNHSLNAGDKPGTLQTPDGALGLKQAKPGDENALGGVVDDVVVAGKGNDYVEGGANNDIIYGDRGGRDLSDNLLVNGDFAHDGSGKQGGGSNWGTYENIEGWYADNNLEGQEASDGLIEIQTFNTVAPGSNLDNSDGHINVLELDSHNHGDNGSDNTNTTVSQDVTLDSGGTFKLSFEYANRPKNGDETTSPFEVLVNGEVVLELDNEQEGWTSTKLELDLEAGPNTISFRGTGTEDTYGALIDNVSLQRFESSHNDLLIGDNGPDAETLDKDGNESSGGSGDDLIRGNRGDDIIIGDNFNAFSYNEFGDGFELADPIVEVNLSSSSTAYNADGTFGDVDTGSAKAGGTGYGVEGETSDRGIDQQIGFDINAGEAGASEVLSVCLDEHTMVAQVGISNLFANEGDGGIDETGHWAAYREGILVAEGDFTANDLTGTSNNNGYLTIGPGETGFRAFDELQFSAVGPQFNNGGPDSSDFYITSVTTDGLTGDGTDILRGGKGDDVILGGDNDGMSYQEQDDVDPSLLTSSPEKIFGGKGDDWLDGGDGVDHLRGGKGDDIIIGGGGADEIRAGKGNDIVAFDAEDTFVGGGKGFDVLVASDKDIPKGEDGYQYVDVSGDDEPAEMVMKGVDIDMSKGGNIKGFEAVVGTSAHDTLSVSLGRLFNQNHDIDGNRAKNTDEKEAEFFALGIEEINISGNWAGDGNPDGDPTTISETIDDPDLLEKLGLDGSKALTAYTFTKGDKSITIYSDLAADEVDFNFV